VTTDIGLSPADNPERWDTVFFDGSPLPGIAKVNVDAARKMDSRSAPGANGARLLDKGQEPAKVTIVVRMWLEEHFAEWARVMPSLHYREERVRPTAAQIEAATTAARDAARAAADAAALRGIGALGTANEAAATATALRLSRAAAALRAAGPRSVRPKDGIRRERRASTIEHPQCAFHGISLVYVERISSPHPERGILEVTLTCLEAQQQQAVMSPNVTRAPTRTSQAQRQGIGDIQTALPPSDGNTGPA
jgi:hypothetical protein